MTRPTFAFLLLAAGCGGFGRQLGTTLTATSPSPAAGTFACAVSEARALGHTRMRVDQGDRTFDAERAYEAARGGGGFEVRRVDVLSVKVTDAKGSSGADLSVRAESFSEQMSRRGITRVGEVASDSVRAAARRVIERCGTPE